MREFHKSAFGTSPSWRSRGCSSGTPSGWLEDYHDYSDQIIVIITVDNFDRFWSSLILTTNLMTIISIIICIITILSVIIIFILIATSIDLRFAIYQFFCFWSWLDLPFIIINILTILTIIIIIIVLIATSISWLRPWICLLSIILLLIMIVIINLIIIIITILNIYVIIIIVIISSIIPISWLRPWICLLSCTARRPLPRQASWSAEQDFQSAIMMIMITIMMRERMRMGIMTEIKITYIFLVFLG